MFSVGVLFSIYITSAVLGSGFIIFNFLIGQIDGGDGGSGNDFTGADDSGGAGNDFGGADDSSGAGNDFGGADDSSGAGNDFGGADNGGAAGGGHRIPIRLTPLISSARNSSTTIFHPEQLGGQIGQFVLGLLSPMTLSVFCTFFGLTGAIVLHYFPALGYLTLLPAMFVSWVVSQSFKLLMRWMVKNMEVSTEAKVSDLVGQLAEVNIPFKDGNTGEVTFVVHSKRINSAARPFKPGSVFTRGTKVLIVGMQDHVVLVEPYADFQITEA